MRHARLIGIFLCTILTVPALAAADYSAGDHPTEGDAYCERERNGSPRNDPAFPWYPEVVPADFQPLGPGTPTLLACEGEHWDGQDAANADGACTGGDTDGTDGEGGVAVQQCADPAEHSWMDVTSPVGARASAAGNGNGGALYASARVAGASTVAVHAGGCSRELGDAAAPGMAATEGCQGDHGHGVVGVFWRDDSFQNFVSILACQTTRITRCYIADADCTQEEYADSLKRRFAGEPETCGRDNTAVSVELLA